MKRLLPALFTLLTFVSCAHPNLATAPQTAVANYGAKVLDSVHAVSVSVADLHERGIISTDDAALAMIFGNRAGEAGQQLATLLDAYDKGSADVRAAMSKDIATQITVLSRAVREVAKAAPIPEKFKGDIDRFAELIQRVFESLSALTRALPSSQPQGA